MRCGRPSHWSRPFAAMGGLRWKLTVSRIALLHDLTGFDVGNAQMPTLSMATLHPEIRAVAENMFRDSYYSEGVGRAAKAVNAKVRRLTGRLRDDGVKMRHQLFALVANGSTRLSLGPIQYGFSAGDARDAQFSRPCPRRMHRRKRRKIELRNRPRVAAYVFVLRTLKNGGPVAFRYPPRQCQSPGRTLPACGEACDAIYEADSSNPWPRRS